MTAIAEYTGGWGTLVQAIQPTSHSLFLIDTVIDRSGTQLFHHDVLIEKNRILIPFPFDFHAQYFWTLYSVDGSIGRRFLVGPAVAVRSTVALTVNTQQNCVPTASPCRKQCITSYHVRRQSYLFLVYSSAYIFCRTRNALQY